MLINAAILSAKPTNTGLPDGFHGAPAGTAQYTTLLNGYAVRPPWHVAGVDYAVGPNGTPTSNPVTSTPSGCSISGSQLRVIADNVTINGYDFTVSNGISIYCPSNNNLTIENCKFGGTNYSSLSTGIIDFRGVNFSIKYCTIDGASTMSSTQSTLMFISPSSSGSVTLQYLWCKNYPQHILELLNSATLTYQFNLIDNFVLAQPSGIPTHMNWLQLSDGTVSTNVQFNTARQTISPGAEGFQQYFNDVGTIVSPILSYNTSVIPVGGEMSNVFHGSGLGTGSTTLSGTGTCSNNYFDISGSDGFAGHPNAFYPSSFASGWVGSGNKNMSTGATITFPV